MGPLGARPSLKFRFEWWSLTLQDEGIGQHGLELVLSTYRSQLASYSQAFEWPFDGTGEGLGFRYYVPTRTLRRGSLVPPSWSTHMRVRS